MSQQPAQPALAVTTGHQRPAVARRATALHGRRRAHRPPVRRTAGRVLEIILLSAFAILVVAPIYWALVTSLRTPAQSFTNPPAWIPAHPMWSNYSAVFHSVPFWDFDAAKKKGIGGAERYERGFDCCVWDVIDSCCFGRTGEHRVGIW